MSITHRQTDRREYTCTHISRIGVLIINWKGEEKEKEREKQCEVLGTKREIARIHSAKLTKHFTILGHKRPSIANFMQFGKFDLWIFRF